MYRVFIIHGWGGYPEEAWFPWLKEELDEADIDSLVPIMPNTDKPQIDLWVNHLRTLIDLPDEDVYLVGHSIGVQAIFRYLEKINTPIGGVLAVSGFFTLKPETFETPEDQAIARPWLETPINDISVRDTASQITAIFSDNDPFVGLDNVQLFEERLKAKTIVLENKGHMGTNDGFKEIPEIHKELLKLMGLKTDLDSLLR